MNVMKKIVLAASLIVSASVSTFAFADESCQQINTYGVAQGNQSYLDICRPGYFISYNEKTKSPAWVAERMTKESLDGKTTSRTNNFRPDPSIPEQYRASLNDFRGSGYDRGHMAPAEDFRNSAEEMSDSFYLSNMIPQNSQLNRGTWAVLEKNMRYWAKKYGEILVTTGPIYYQGKTLGYAGSIPVPTHIFKAVYIPKINESIAFILPNQQVNTDQLPRAVSSIKNLSLLTGINFYPNVSESVKSQVPSDLKLFNR